MPESATPKDETHASIYLSRGLRSLRDRSVPVELSDRLDEIVSIYQELVQRERPTLSISEWCALTDLLNSTQLSVHTVRCLWYSVEDAGQMDGLGTEWDIDIPSLVQRLREMSFGQLVAVVETAMGYWEDPSRNIREYFAGLGCD